MPVSLLKQAFQTKEKLKVFGLERFAKEYQNLRKKLLETSESGEMDTLQERALEDWFLLEHILPDHRTVLSHFIEQAEDAADVMLAEQWGLIIQGVFHVRSIKEEQCFELMNLVNDVVYTVMNNPATPIQLDKGEYIVARLLAHQDYHLFTGVIDRLPTRKKSEIYELVSEIQLQEPRMAFIDNPERIAAAYAIQKEEREDFITFFGSDEILLRGDHLEEKLKEFYHYRFFQKRLDNGETIAKTFQERYHQPPLPPHFAFGDHLKDENDIGVIYDATEGLVFLLHFGAFEQIFAQPVDWQDEEENLTEAGKSARKLVLNYLEDPHITALPFQRMIARYPEQAVEVFKHVLKRKRFDLDKDFDAVIQRFKPMVTLTHLTPSTIPSVVRNKTFLRSLKSKQKW